MSAMRRLFSFAVPLLFAVCARANTLLVPDNYSTIQAAIDASALHDTVLVAPGTYFENINYHGHNIVVASRFLIDHNPATINTTIINGSQPAHPDTGSVVRIISGEDSTAMLVGFTITGGTGTPLRDQNNQLTYIEAGGVMADSSSPVIAFNYIVSNTASRTAPGISSSGGGGIRVGFGRPKILNNVIANNTGRFYGGGVVVNFASATLRNNVIVGNTGGQTYGGGGVWVYGSSFVPTVIENNTITGNNSTLNGGGVLVSTTSAYLRNNIIWANRARTTGAQIERSSMSGTVTYNDIQGGFAGLGNINLYPQFADTQLTLASGSPCINAGDSSAIYNDPDGSRNDMGAYGGPGAASLARFSAPSLALSTRLLEFGTATPGTPILRNVVIANSGSGGLRVDSARLAGSSAGAVTFSNVPGHLSPYLQDTIHVTWTPPSEAGMNDTLFIYSNDLVAGNPAQVVLIGLMSEDVPPAENSGLPKVFRLLPNYPNPFNPATQIRFDLPIASQVRLEVFDLLGNRTALLMSERLPAGTHTITWNAAQYPSGIYFCRLHAGTFVQTQQMMLLK